MGNQRRGLISGLRPVCFFLGKQPCREPPRGARSFPRLKLTGPSTEINPTLVAPTARYYPGTGRRGKRELHFFGHFRTSPRPPINYPTNIRSFGAFLAKIPMLSAQCPIDPIAPLVFGQYGELSAGFEALIDTLAPQ